MVEFEVSTSHLKFEKQALSLKIHNYSGKFHAAFLIQSKYKIIRDILKKDAVYFDMVLNLLCADTKYQCRCIIQATEMGLVASAQVTELRKEYQLMERQVKANMRERDIAVNKMKQEVENLEKEFIFLTGPESEHNLLEPKKVTSTVLEPSELEDLNRILTQVQKVTLVDTYDDIFTRMETQLLNRIWLLQETFDKSNLQQELINKKMHGVTMISSVTHSMTDDLLKYQEDKRKGEEMLENERLRIEEGRAGIKKVRQLYVTVRCSLQTLFDTLALVREPDPIPSFDDELEDVPEYDDDMWTPSTENLWILQGEEADDIAPSTEIDAYKLLKQVTGKLKVLIDTVPQEPTTRIARIAKDQFQKTLAESLMKTDLGEVEDDDLIIEDFLEDSTVLTRADVKLRSKRYVSQFEKSDLDLALIAAASKGFGKK